MEHMPRLSLADDEIITDRVEAVQPDILAASEEGDAADDRMGAPNPPPQGDPDTDW